MQSDCDDIRFMDSDKTTPLVYWLEQGCNTSATQIWVTVPTIPATSQKEIYLVYGNSTSINASETYSGSFITMFNVSCPSGWSSFSGLNDSNRFPRGSTSYGGTGGTTAHAVHTFSGTTTGPSITISYGTTSSAATSYTHTHTYSGTVSSTANNQIPPYLSVIFCSADDPAPLLPTSSISWYSSLPSGWSSFSGLNDSNRFPRGNTSYGETGGATTHTHPYSTGSSNPSAGGSSGTKAYIPNDPHTHTVSGTTSGGSNVPPYLDVIAATPDATAPFEANVIVPTNSNSAPPLGWNLFTSLNSSNLFPRGNTSYGETGGATTHNHTSNGTKATSVPSNNTGQHGATGNPYTLAQADHTHNYSFTTSTATGIQPPYLDVVFIQRKTVSVSVDLGSEISANSSPTIFFSDSLNGNIGIGTIDIGSYLFRVGGGMIAQSYATGHIIESRIYPKEEESFTVGDLLSITEALDSNQTIENARFTKSSYAYDQNIIGIAEYNDSDGYRPTISGVFKTKVSTINGLIKTGDPVTSSKIPGVGMKSTEAGPIVGKALEPFGLEQTLEPCTAPYEQYQCGKIEIFINISWYNPDVYLTDTGDIFIEKIITEDGEEEFVVKDSTDGLIEKVSILKEAVIGKIKAGLIETKELVTDKLASQEIQTQSLVTPLIETQDIDTERISLKEIDSKPGENLIVNLEKDESGFGKLIIKGKDGQEVASIDSLGNATFSGEITADKGKFEKLLSKVITSENLETKDATITGTLYADKIVSNEIVSLEGKFGELLAATVSAQKIQGLEERLAQLEANKETASAISSPTPPPETITEEESPATESSNIDPMADLELSPDIEALVDEILKTSTEATSQADLNDISGENLMINNNLTVLGNTSLGDTSVAGSLNIGGTLNLADNSINSLIDNLYLQNLGLGGIDILAGKITIDSQGNVVFKGDVAIKGRLALSEIEPLPDQDLIINLDNQSESEEESSFGKLIVKGVDQETIASIDSSGTSTFKKVAIANAKQETNQISENEIETNATAGQATLTAHDTEITIKSHFVTDDTMIYVTPTSDPDNKVLFIKAKKADSPEEIGWFRVGIDKKINQDINFNWWIIN
ncbi:MAG TPA: DUF2341 domain-containing protein [Patescibacteria group bacterium]|nr:DUF2341 domain-containing protein [Patescibacteria group bacterium]